MPKNPWPANSGTVAASVEGALLATVISVPILIEDLAAGADVAARACFMAPLPGCTLTNIGIIPQGASADIDDSNTAVIVVATAAGNAIVSKTYNTATQPPAANVHGTLGTLSSTYKVLTTHQVITVAITQGTTADLPAFILNLEYTVTGS